MDQSSSSSIINKIMDMDLNDNDVIKNVIDIITSRSSRNAFFLGSLIATSMHQNVVLKKKLFFYHDAWTPKDLHAFIFKIEGTLGFLVNIVETDDIPYDLDEYFGDHYDVEDIPLPPLRYLGIMEVVRIDVSDDRRFTIRKLTVSESGDDKADGRFNLVPTVDVSNIVESLHRGEEGFKAIGTLTNFHEFNIDSDSEDYEEYIPAHPAELPDSNTFENKILNYVHLHQRYMRNVGDLKSFAEAILLGVIVSYPYDGDGENILAVQSPIDDTVFMIAFDHICAPTTEEHNNALESNVDNLLTHYVPDYTVGANKKNVILLAITYNNVFEPEFDSVDNIVSLRHTAEFYVKKLSLMDRCRYVILKNKDLLENYIYFIPPHLQSYIWSCKHPLL